VQQRLAHRLECSAQFGSKELGLLPGSEVSTLVDFVEVDKAGVGAPGPCFRSSIDFPRKHGNGYRERDLVGFLHGRNERATPLVLLVQPR
jgi:hypothetical protein